MMMQTELLTKRNVASIGEEIAHELGEQMIQAYHKANPADVKAYVIGQDIINQILAQPGCVGIRFYNALDENGQKTLVYIGLDANGKNILTYSSVNTAGILTTKKAIVADRIERQPTNPDEGDWTWTVD